jgi:glutathione S-transferase
MKIFINPLTANSIKILLLCNALKIKPEIKLITHSKREQYNEEFLAISPEGKLPVLQDNDLIMSESNTILQYVAAKHKSVFWPSKLNDQANVLHTLFCQADYFNTNIAPFVHLKVVMPFWGFSKKEIDSKQITNFHKAVNSIESTFKKRRFFATNTLSIADIGLSAFFILADRAEMPLESYPHTQIWLKKMSNETWFTKTKKYLDNILS